MPQRDCRWESCKLNAAENGHFCPNHYRMLPLELRGRLLAYPPRPGPPPPGRNQTIHACLLELRRQIEPDVYRDRPHPAAS